MSLMNWQGDPWGEKYWLRNKSSADDMENEDKFRLINGEDGKHQEMPYWLSDALKGEQRFGDSLGDVRIMSLE
jgi:hypothetical protein